MVLASFGIQTLFELRNCIFTPPPPLDKVSRGVKMQFLNLNKVERAKHVKHMKHLRQIEVDVW